MLDGSDKMGEETQGVLVVSADGIPADREFEYIEENLPAGMSCHSRLAQ